jgi:hypothetical protein
MVNINSLVVAAQFFTCHYMSGVAPYKVVKGWYLMVFIDAILVLG